MTIAHGSAPALSDRDWVCAGLLTFATRAILCPHQNQLISHHVLQDLLHLFDQLVEVSSTALGQNWAGKETKSAMQVATAKVSAWEGRPVEPHTRLDASSSTREQPGDRH